MASVALTKGALWMQNVDYPASWDRVLIDALYQNEGVIDGFVVSPDGDLDIQVTGGRAIVQGDEVVGQGKYLIDQDATVSLTLASVGVNRTEYVWLSVNDTAVSGGRAGNNITIQTSTTIPPDSALLLATLTLPLGASTITSGMIADNRTFTDTVAAGSVTNAKLAAGSVTGAAIADGAITAAKIASGAVVAAKVGAAAITTTKIDDLAVTTEKLANESVTLAKLSSAVVALIEALDPADAIIAIGGATAPTGWALCDGAPYSRTTFPATFARIGITHGAGDGSTTFNVPDLRNKFIAGKGPAAWSGAVNTIGGGTDTGLLAHSHSNTVTASQDPHVHYYAGSGTTGAGGAHAHNMGSEDVFYNGALGATGFTNVGGGMRLADFQPAPDHNHGFSFSGYTDPATSSGVPANNVYVTVTNGAVTGATTTTATNGNLPPYRTLNYCIRMR